MRIALQAPVQPEQQSHSSGPLFVQTPKESKSVAWSQMLLDLLPCYCSMGNTHSLAVNSNDGNIQHRESPVDLLTNEKPSYDEVCSWQVSFDQLMRSKVGQKLFGEFLKSEYSDENILFWQACEELKKERNPEKIEEKARIIYEDFVSILSPKEVSLDSRVREIVNVNMRSPSGRTFDEAQNQIYTLMHRDSYPRFVNSNAYKAVLGSYGAMEEL